MPLLTHPQSLTAECNFALCLLHHTECFSLFSIFRAQWKRQRAQNFAESVRVFVVVVVVVVAHRWLYVAAGSSIFSQQLTGFHPLRVLCGLCFFFLFFICTGLAVAKAARSFCGFSPYCLILIGQRLNNLL